MDVCYKQIISQVGFKTRKNGSRHTSKFRLNKHSTCRNYLQVLLICTSKDFISLHVVYKIRIGMIVYYFVLIQVLVFKCKYAHDSLSVQYIQKFTQLFNVRVCFLHSVVVLQAFVLFRRVQMTCVIFLQYYIYRFFKIALIRLVFTQFKSQVLNQLSVFRDSEEK